MASSPSIGQIWGLWEPQPSQQAPAYNAPWKVTVPSAPKSAEPPGWIKGAPVSASRPSPSPKGQMPSEVVRNETAKIVSGAGGGRVQVTGAAPSPIRPDPFAAAFAQFPGLLERQEVPKPPVVASSPRSESIKPASALTPLPPAPGSAQDKERVRQLHGGPSQMPGRPAAQIPIAAPIRLEEPRAPIVFNPAPRSEVAKAAPLVTAPRPPAPSPTPPDIVVTRSASEEPKTGVTPSLDPLFGPWIVPSTPPPFVFVDPLNQITPQAVNTSGGVPPQNMSQPTSLPDGTTPPPPSNPSEFNWQSYLDNFGRVYEQVGQVLKTFQTQPGATQAPQTVDPKPAPQRVTADDSSWLWLVLVGAGIYVASR